MDGSPESGSYCMVKTPEKEEKKGEEGEKGKGEETQETAQKEEKKPETNVGDLPSPQKTSKKKTTSGKTPTTEVKRWANQWTEQEKMQKQEAKWN